MSSCKISIEDFYILFGRSECSICKLDHKLYPTIAIFRIFYSMYPCLLGSFGIIQVHVSFRFFPFLEGLRVFVIGSHPACLIGTSCYHGPAVPHMGQTISLQTFELYCVDGPGHYRT